MYSWSLKASYKRYCQPRLYNQGGRKPSGRRQQHRGEVYWIGNQWPFKTCHWLRSKFRPKKYEELVRFKTFSQVCYLQTPLRPEPGSCAHLDSEDFWHCFRLPYGIQQEFPEKPHQGLWRRTRWWSCQEWHNNLFRETGIHGAKTLNGVPTVCWGL